MKVWLWILQRAPMTAPFWISTKVPTEVSSPMVQPYRLTNAYIRTLRPRRTSGATRRRSSSRSVRLSSTSVADRGHRAVQADQYPALLDRALGRLQDPYHARTGPAVRHQRLASVHGGHDVLRLDRQRLAGVELGCVHVAGAVRDHELVLVARIAGDRDALVVDLELLAG